MSKTQAFVPPAELPARPLHIRGMMHRIVDGARAGWVHDWRDVAAAHASELAPAETEEADDLADVTSAERGGGGDGEVAKSQDAAGVGELV